MTTENKTLQNTEPDIAVEPVLAPVIWAIRCEDRYYTYSNYFVEANTEEEAWAEFTNIKHGTKSNSKGRYKNIVITPVK